MGKTNAMQKIVSVIFQILELIFFDKVKTKKWVSNKTDYAFGKGCVSLSRTISLSDSPINTIEANIKRISFTR
jgi:hypothetical protein